MGISDEFDIGDVDLISLIDFVIECYLVLGKWLQLFLVVSGLSAIRSHSSIALDSVSLSVPDGPGLRLTAGFFFFAIAISSNLELLLAANSARPKHYYISQSGIHSASNAQTRFLTVLNIA